MYQQPCSINSYWHAKIEGCLVLSTTLMMRDLAGTPSVTSLASIWIASCSRASWCVVKFPLWYTVIHVAPSLTYWPTRTSRTRPTLRSIFSPGWDLPAPSSLDTFATSSGSMAVIMPPFVARTSFFCWALGRTSKGFDPVEHNLLATCCSTPCAVSMLQNTCLALPLCSVALIRALPSSTVTTLSSRNSSSPPSRYTSM